MKDVYNKFKFIEDKAGKDIPPKLRLVYSPDTLEKDENGHPWIFGPPDDGIIESATELVYRYDVTSLPENLHVEGDLTLIRLPNLEELPEGLVVHGSLYLRELPIRTIPKGMEIDGTLVIVDCDKLEKIPDGFHVSDLELNGCLGLKNLPNNLKVGGGVYITDTPLESVPNGLEAKRFYLTSRDVFIPLIGDLQNSETEDSQTGLRREILERGGKVGEVTVSTKK